jgi:hypothetical protein
LLQLSSNISAFLGRYSQDASLDKNAPFGASCDSDKLLIETSALENVFDVYQEMPPDTEALAPLDWSTPTVPVKLALTEVVSEEVVAWFVSGSLSRS